MRTDKVVNLFYYNHGIHIEQDINNTQHCQMQINILERIIKTQKEEIKFLRKIVEFTERKKNLR
jgi:hypothetical protein